MLRQLQQLVTFLLVDQSSPNFLDSFDTFATITFHSTQTNSHSHTTD